MPAAAVMSGRPAGCRAVGGYCRPSPDLARRFSARPTAEALSAASLAKPTQQRSTDGEKIRLELDEEAIQYIVRGLTNLATHDGTWPSEGPRFARWLSENRPDLDLAG
jgi:hypothetical protein